MFKLPISIAFAGFAAMVIPTSAISQVNTSVATTIKTQVSKNTPHTQTFKTLSCAQALHIIQIRGFANLNAVDCVGSQFRFVGLRGHEKQVITMNAISGGMVAMPYHGSVYGWYRLTAAKNHLRK